MTRVYRGALDRITRVRGVRGAMVVARDDGLIVSDALMDGVRGNAVAALASSLVKRVGNATEASGVGALQFLHMQASDGVLLAVPANEEILVVAIGDATANIGLVRLELLQAAEAVR